MRARFDGKADANESVSVDVARARVGGARRGARAIRFLERGWSRRAASDDGEREGCDAPRSRRF